MDGGERDKLRTRLLDIALRATQLAEVIDDKCQREMIDELRTLGGQVAMLETALRASRSPDDETMA